MKLYENFKSIVNRRGSAIVRQKAFLNILNDINAFEDDDKVVFKKIMREMYNDGFVGKIIDEGKANGMLQNLIFNFVKTTGCQTHIVEYITKCFLYSVDKISEKDMLKAYDDFITYESGKTIGNKHKPRPETGQQPDQKQNQSNEESNKTNSDTNTSNNSDSSNTSNPFHTWLRKNAIWFVPCIILLIVATIFVAQTTSKSNVEKAVKEKEAIMLVSDTVFNIMPDELLGNYSVKIESNNQVKRLTGFIDRNQLGFLTLHVLSEYEPMVFTLNIENDGKITNQDLGEAYLVHKKSIDKRIICFQKDNTTCTLTR